MKADIKISLPVYKIVYSLAFVLLLSLVRGIIYVEEIGIAMEPAIALLSIVFCADTYLMERMGKREDIFTLCERRKKTKVILRRLAVQMIYLIVISAVGYGFFYWQKPVELNIGSSDGVFGMFLIAMTGTVVFWGLLSMTIGNLARNLWFGIGGTLLIWMEMNSKAGDQLLGKWNVFSFTFREINTTGNWDFMCGKLISVCVAIVMAAAIPIILKKRG